MQRLDAEGRAADEAPCARAAPAAEGVRAAARPHRAAGLAARQDRARALRADDADTAETLQEVHGGVDHKQVRVELQMNLREVFTITEKIPTRAFSWLKVPTSAFTFKTLLRHYA